MVNINPEQGNRAIERIRLELVTRKLMVQVLAMIAVWVGIAMCLTGAPSFLETWFSPWSRYVIGGVAFIAGLVTSVGGLLTDERHTGWWAQVSGLSLLTIWYTAMGGAYWGLLLAEGFSWAQPGEPLDPSSSGRGYVIIVYAGLAVMTSIPLVTMLRLSRPGVLGRGPHDACDD